MRLQNPSVAFTASANLATTADETGDGFQADEYMTSLQPEPVNLLAALKRDPGLAGSVPYLLDSRLSRVVPVAQDEKRSFQVRQKIQRPIRVVPAVSARIRYSRLNTFSSKLTTIASLDFEVTPLISHDVILEKIEITLGNGTAEKLTSGSVEPLSLPVTCRPRDDITFLYRLMPESVTDVNTSTTAVLDVLDILVESQILVSDRCRARIAIDWKANVEFSTPLNPMFGGPSQGIQRPNRPTSIPVTSSASTIPQTISGRTTPRTRASSTTDMGVTITFSGLKRVEVGKKFHWNVFIVNRSTKPRKIVLVAIPLRRRGDIQKYASKRLSSANNPRKEDITEAVADENIVYATQKNATMHGTDLICISTEVRVGYKQHPPRNLAARFANLFVGCCNQVVAMLLN